MATESRPSKRTRRTSTVVKSLTDSSADSDLSYTVTSDFVSISDTNETDFLLVRNNQPTDSETFIQDIVVGIDAMDQRLLVRIYKIPTVTNGGSALIERNRNLKGSGRTADLDVTKLPTISDRGKLMNVFVLSSNSSSVSIPVNYKVPKDRRFLISVQKSGSGTHKVHVDMNWIEVI